MRQGGGMPPSMRGITTSGPFGSQQPQQQPGRSGMANRPPNGKMGNGTTGWSSGFGQGALPLSGGGLASSSRQIGGQPSFAQSVGGSQSQPPLGLDMSMSEFPSLSTNSQLSSGNQSTLWGASNTRVGGPVQRSHGTPVGSQSNLQDELFHSRLSSAQGAFRFGSLSTAALSQGHPSSADEFPPLSRNVNGDIGQEQRSGLMSSFDLGSQGSTAPSRTENGLLNVLSANITRAPATGQSSNAAGQLEQFTTHAPQGRPQDTRSLIGDDETRQKPFREGSLTSQASMADAPVSANSNRNPLGAIGAIGSDAHSSKGKEEDKSNGEIQDPLEGMAPIDKFGMKGLNVLLNNFPDYRAIVTGVDRRTLGLDLNSHELISPQIYSLFDSRPPRQPVPKWRQPECYKVQNVQVVDSKISNFNEETLMWIFYDNPGDAKQGLAAGELHRRNWRWNKRLQLWVTKDEMMVPQQISPQIERGLYIVWDTNKWCKDRRDLTLNYADLDTTPSTMAAGPA